MTRPARYFAIAAAVLALVALQSKLSLRLMDFQIHDTYYVYSPAVVFSGMAIALGLFAAIYAIVPRIRHGGWHFWLTTIGIALFWSGSFLFLHYHPSGNLHGGAQAVAISWLASFPLILIAQGIFLVNLISGLVKLRTSR